MNNSLVPPEQATTRDGRHTSFCRVCHNYCPLIVTVEQGQVTKVEGDRENEIWRGHTCIKGRNQHKRMYGPHRLLHSQRRTALGRFAPVTVETAMDEIAACLGAIIAEHGVDSVAFYAGNLVIANVASHPVFTALMRALGARMYFNPNTIDKPGKSLAAAMHGSWMAPPYGYHEPDACLLIGNNPYVSYEGAPIGNPGWLAEQTKRGMQLIVIDPRRTSTADRATIHLAPRPGYDSEILAAFLRVALDEQIYDPGFVADNVNGVEDLRRAVEPYTPERVAERARISSEDLVAAARIYCGARRAYSYAGVGPSMSDPGPLLEYLVLCIDSLSGHWMRAGDKVDTLPALLATPEYKAQAAPPWRVSNPDFAVGVRGLVETAAGLPAAALADMILREGEGRIRALISCAGNPVGAFPNEPKVVAAMKRLDLLVQVDPVMSHTAELADYVIAPRMALENPDMSQFHDYMTAASHGNRVSHGMYAPAVVDPPDGSDLAVEWEFFCGLAERLGVDELTIIDACWGNSIRPFTIDVRNKPTHEELLELLARDSRIPLAEVKRHPHGQVFPDPPVFVEEKEANWPHRLDVGNAEMMEELGRVAVRPAAEDPPDQLRFVCRRTRSMYCTFTNDGETEPKGRTDNPAYVHPDDLERLGFAAGDVVEIRSAHGAICAVVEPDRHLRPGLLSMSHGYGKLDPSGRQVSADPRAHGASVQRLIDDETDFDPYSGMPPMSNIPVTLTRV